MVKAMKVTVTVGITVLVLAGALGGALNSGALDGVLARALNQASSQSTAPQPTLEPKHPAPTTNTPSKTPTPQGRPRSGALWNGVSMTPAAARKALRNLLVEAPHSMSGYSRDLFPHWNDATTWGWTGVDLPYEDCDVRAAALIRDGKNVATNEYCTVESGTWRSAYDDSTLTDPSEVDGEHIVPLGNAWRSGADEWGTYRATRFANDPLVVLAAPASLNSSKGDRGPESWKPAREAWCGYAVRWIEVKKKYRLFLTSASERAALNKMLKTC